MKKNNRNRLTRFIVSTLCILATAALCWLACNYLVIWGINKSLGTDIPHIHYLVWAGVVFIHVFLHDQRMINGWFNILSFTDSIAAILKDVMRSATDDEEE